MFVNKRAKTNLILDALIQLHENKVRIIVIKVGFNKDCETEIIVQKDCENNDVRIMTYFWSSSSTLKVLLLYLTVLSLLFVTNAFSFCGSVSNLLFRHVYDATHQLFLN